jgi:molybdenum cofactor cytidylyltransferase
VVVGAVDLAAEGLVPAGVETLDNPYWRQGLATSLRRAVTAGREAGVDSLVVGLGDQPLVPASAWAAVGASRGRPIAVASYQGVRRNPVRLDREVWDLLPQSGDEGARVLVAGRPELVMAVACDGDPADIDTVEDLGKWS